MRIISPTKLQRKKLIEMIPKLFPQYQFVKVNRNGIISMSKSIWHWLIFKTERVHVSEMCTVHIPERLDELYYKTFEDDGTPIYHRVYNKYSHIVLELLHHRSKSVIDYLYDEYTHIKYGVRRLYYTKNNALPERTYALSEVLLKPVRRAVKRDALVLSRLSPTQVRQSLKYWKDFATNFKHPALVSNYLNMWFKKEIKEKLEQYYQLKISIA